MARRIISIYLAAEKKRKVRKMSVKKRGVTKSIRHSRCGPSSAVCSARFVWPCWPPTVRANLVGCWGWTDDGKSAATYRIVTRLEKRRHGIIIIISFALIDIYTQPSSLSLLCRTRILDTLLFSGTFFGLLLLLDGSATFGSVDRGYASICSAVAAAKYVCRLVGNLLTAPLFWWTDRFVL